MSLMENKPVTKDEFFVGYLPTPPGVKRWLIGVAAAVLVVTVALGAGVAAVMRPTGDAKWDTDHVTKITGTLYAKPYIHLNTGDLQLHDALADLRDIVLIIEDGKHGPRASLAAYDGQNVTIAGHLLTRGRYRMLEVVDAPGDHMDPPSPAPKPARQEPQATPDPADISTIRAEIIDPKCYFGSMKPGDGKPHKGCAALCLRGGIPPMLARPPGWAMVPDCARGPDCYVIVDEDGGPLTGERLEYLIGFVGEPVTVRGWVQNYQFRLAHDGISR